MVICENLVKIYKTSEIEVVALQGLDLTVESGELMAIIGNSGSGKSTLLNMLGGLDRPSAGSLSVDGKDMLKFTPQDYIKYKRETVGFVWQNNARNLIQYMTALDNIELPMMFNKARSRERALELIDIVGLSKRRNSKLSQLSGGEQQRIAIAISLANKPKLILADEPTGSVDSKNADAILDIFREVNRQLGVTVIIVTHDGHLSKKVDRVVAIRDGRTSSEYIRMSSSYAAQMMNLTDTLHDTEDHEQVELVVIDGAGRLQIPKNYLDSMGISGKSRVKVEMDGENVVIIPFESNAQ